MGFSHCLRRCHQRAKIRRLQRKYSSNRKSPLRIHHAAGLINRFHGNSVRLAPVTGSAASFRAVIFQSLPSTYSPFLHMFFFVPSFPASLFIFSFLSSFSASLLIFSCTSRSDSTIHTTQVRISHRNFCSYVLHGRTSRIHFRVASCTLSC